MKNYFFVLITLFFSLYEANSQEAMDYWTKSLSQLKDEKDYIGAVESLNKLLEYNSSIPEAYYNRAIAKIMLGDFKGACSDFNLTKIFDNVTKDKNKLIKRAPDYIDYYCNKDYLLNLMHKYFYKGVKLDPEHDNRPFYTMRDTLRGALRPERACFDVTYYDLNVRILPVTKRIKGKNDIYFRVIHATKTIQIDLFERYDIEKIEWNGQLLAYERRYDAIFIKFSDYLPAGSKQMISITYSGKPRKAPNPPWDCGFVWKRDKDHNRWVGVCCEQYGASSWWPNKDHLSDKCDSMQISIETPGNLPVICNGVFRKSTKLEDGYTRHTWFVSYPINNYDVTFYWGNYQHIPDTVVFQGDTLKGNYYVLPNNYERAKKYFKQTGEVVKFYCAAFGRYPFWRDGFGQVESPYEGMENQEAIAYGNSFGDDTSRDYHCKKYDPIIVHEFAHEWWGNSVTASDMADAWLHEGFATYAELMFLERKIGYDEYRIELKKNRDRIYNFWPMIENYNVNENAMASSDIYMKGSAVLDNLRSTINNDSVFFKILHDFPEKYKYQVVNTHNFVDFVDSMTGDNYMPFFNKFLYETTLPVLKYKYERMGDSTLLSYKWAEVENGFKMPVCIKVNDKKSMRLDVTTEWQTILLEDAKKFGIYTQWSEDDGALKNAYTYFWTEKESE